MPWRDWQFYVVTFIAFLGAWVLARTFLPKRSVKHSKRANLTISAPSHEKTHETKADRTS